MSTSTKLIGPSFEDVLALRTIFGEERPIALLPLSIQAKVPLVAWKMINERGYGWTPDELKERWRGRENIGIITGPPSQNIYVVDCDGIPAVKWVLANFPPSPMMQKTGSGEGLHVVYVAPEGEMTRNRSDILGSKAKWEYEAGLAGFDIHPNIVEGMSENDIAEEHFRAAEHRRLARENIELGPVIDVRGAGGQIAGPGSVHSSGNTYKMVKPWTPEMFESMDRISPSFLDKVKKWERPDKRPTGRLEFGVGDFKIRTPSEKLKRASAYLSTMKGAVSGDNGHDRTFYPANLMVRGFDLGVEDAVMLLLGPWNDRCDPPWSEKDVRHKCVDAAKAEDGRPNGWMLVDRPEYAARKQAAEQKKLTKADVTPDNMMQVEYEQVHPDATLNIDEDGNVVEDIDIAAALDVVDEIKNAPSEEDVGLLNDDHQAMAKALGNVGINFKDLKAAGWTMFKMRFIRGVDGQSGRWVFKPTVANMTTVLLFSKMFKGSLTWDDLKIQKMYEGRRYTDMDFSDILIKMEMIFSDGIGIEKLHQAINRACIVNKIDRVGDFYKSIDEWAGDDVISDVVNKNFGINKEDPNFGLYRRVLQNTFVGLMARLDKPGSKMDTVLILQGEQGYRKSTFFADLFPPGMATDAQNFDFRKKDGLMMLSQHVAIEMGEAVHIRSETGYENLKQFLSQTTDTFRPPYGRELLEVPRHCIFFASANDENLFYDPTGTRRFYVIPVRRKMEDGEAAAVRDQLLAQAKHIYDRFRNAKDDEEYRQTRWWFEEDDEWEKARHRANQSYEDHHPWEEPIAGYCAKNAGQEVTTTHILTKTVDKPMGQITTGDQRVVARVLRRLGCELVNRRVDGVRKRMWHIPKHLSPDRFDTSEMPADDKRDEYGWEYKDPDED